MFLCINAYIILHNIFVHKHPNPSHKKNSVLSWSYRYFYTRAPIEVLQGRGVVGTKSEQREYCLSWS